MTRALCIALVVVAAWGMTTAQAGFWQDAFRGLDIFTTPSGFPLQDAGDGSLINGARNGRVRIMPNGFGGGYRLELDRRFGVDTRGRPETFRYGGLEMTLEGDIQGTAGYNNWGRRFRSGFADLSVNNLAYTLKTKSNAQDVELTGTLNVLQELEINQAGFYSLTLNVANTNSEFKVDGVVVRDSKAGNFNVGPIVLKGNVFVDAVGVLLGSLGADISGLQEAFPGSPMGEIVDALTGNLQQARVVAGTTAEKDLTPLLLDSVLGRNAHAGEALLQGLRDGTLTNSAAAGDAGAPLRVPEPSTLLLVALGGLTFRRRRPAA